MAARLPGGLLPAHDETALNVLLWRRRNGRFLCTVDPSFDRARRARAEPRSHGWVHAHPSVPMEQLVVHGVRGEAQLHALREWAQPATWRAVYHVAGAWHGGEPGRAAPRPAAGCVTRAAEVRVRQKSCFAPRANRSTRRRRDGPAE